ncbi:MAG: hypothetical protein ABUT20_45645, partial [Bacteroidota bacterium]
MKRSFIIALHIGYWILYLMLLTLFVIFMEAGVKAASRNYNQVLGFIKMVGSMTILPGLIGFYGFYCLLFDKYLSKKKILLLCIAGAVTVLVAG